MSREVNGKQKIISETLEVSHAMVSQTIRGLRGKRGSDLQDKILKASYKADELYEKANIKIVQYCNQLKVEVVVPK
jgi:predicted transcriptional regulator